MEDNHINEEGTVLEEGIVQIEEETVTEEVRETAGEDAARQPAEKKGEAEREGTQGVDTGGSPTEKEDAGISADVSRVRGCHVADFRSFFGWRGKGSAAGIQYRRAAPPKKRDCWMTRRRHTSGMPSRNSRSRKWGLYRTLRLPSGRRRKPYRGFNGRTAAGTCTTHG